MENKSSSGIGFGGLLTCVFIALKLMGHIDWKWFWVLSPSLIPLVIILIIFMLLGAVTFMDNK